jgi:hypothetical protein
MQFEILNHGRRLHVAARTCRILPAALLLLLVAAPPQAGALEMTSLYTVNVPLDPEDPDARNNAYQTALTQVLVRVTGTTAAAESAELAAVFPNPARYVLQYRPGPDNSLDVSLDGPAIESLLRQFGATIWGTDRPLTLILLGVDWGQGEREIVGADDPGRIAADGRSIDRNRLLRERVQEIADSRGLPIVFPLLDTEELAALSFTDIWGGFDDQLMESAARYGATSVLVGRIRPDSMLEQRWTWYHSNQRRDWSGEPEQAVNLLGDSLANQYAVGGDADVEAVRLTISGIHSVNAYAEIQRFMDNLKGIDRVAVKSASTESITYEVTVRGGSERLDRALELSGLLDRIESGTSGIDGSRMSREIDPFASGDDAFREPKTLEYLYRSI